MLIEKKNVGHLSDLPQKLFGGLKLGEAFIFRDNTSEGPAVGLRGSPAFTSFALIIRNGRFFWTEIPKSTPVEVLPEDALTLVMDMSKIPL